MKFTVFAFVLWGLLAIYWKQLAHIQPLEILFHRIIWTTLILGLFLSLQKKISFSRLFKSPRNTIFALLSSLLIGASWYFFIWAISNGFVLEASFGYFISPIFTLFLAMIFLREPQSKRKIFSIILSIVSVVWLTFGYGRFPFVGVGLGLIFGFYSLTKKQSRLGAGEGVFFEAGFLLIPALMMPFFLGFDYFQSATTNLPTNIFLLVGGGFATALPLTLYAMGAQRISLSKLGVLQYIAPTLQFFVGLLVFREKLHLNTLFGFVILWIAIFIYLAEDFHRFENS